MNGLVEGKAPYPVVNADQIKRKLAEIDDATLREFILDLYLHHPKLSYKTRHWCYSMIPLHWARPWASGYRRFAAGAGLSTIEHGIFNGIIN